MTLQSILGRNYKWWYMYKTASKSSTAYRWSNVSWLIGRLLVLSFTILLWKVNIDAGSNLFTFSQIFTYYIVGGIFFVDNGVHYGISQHIQSGKLSTRMLYPTNTLFIYYIGDTGWRCFTAIVEVILFVVVAIVGFQYFILPNMFNILVFLILCIIGYVMKVYYNYLLGFMAFFIVDIVGIVDSQKSVVGFLSGQILPLTSATFLTFLTYFPFAYFYHHPMQVYLGGYSSPQSIQVAIFGLIWILILHFATIKLWQVGLKKYESVGL
jgi:ABC-2 type transport system permease protein